MELKLNLAKRKLTGKKAKKLIEEGNVLGNIYGTNLESQAVQGVYNEVNNVIRTAGYNMPVQLHVDGGKDHLALVHEVERDVITQRLHHVTFQVILKGQKVTTEVPIKLVGEAPAEKTGKIVITLTDKVEVEAIPSRLPEYLEVNIEELVEENDAKKVSDIKAIAGVEILTNPDLLVAKVDIPRAELEEDEEDAEEIDPADVPSEHGSDEESDEESSNEQTSKKEE